ncbi:MAG: DUF5658 family protein [Planctomycetota bacterium]
MAGKAINKGFPDNCPECQGRLDLLVNGRCPQCKTELVLTRPRRIPRFLSIPPMRYQNRYVWLVFFSAMDIILTSLVLYVWGGSESNPVAESVIERMGFGWAIVFKFGMMLAAVIACEVVGRRNDRTGRRLATASVVINAFPVAYTLSLLSASDPPTTYAALQQFWSWPLVI